jgi:ketosteroid isomerase-like protein
MGEEHVEIVRRAFAELGRGNFWIPDVFDPAVRVGWLDAIGKETETVGLEAMSSFLLDFMENWSALTLEAERIVGGGDRVAVSCAFHGRGKSSGVATDWRHGQVWTLRDGKVIRVESFDEFSDALAAAGLSE